METNRRYTLLDILRAFAIIAMVVYHTLWDLVNVFSCDIPWFYSSNARIFQLSIRWSFILLSGFCWSLGKRHLRRGLTVLAASVIIWAVTRIFTPESVILHGVLTLISLGMLILIPLEKIFNKTPAFLGVLIF